MEGTTPEGAAGDQADQHRARVEKIVEEHGIHTVKLGAVDIDGLWRGKRAPIDYFLESIWREGTHICKIMFGWDIQDQLIPGLKYTGWHTGYPDFYLVPDLSTFAVVPWEEGTASVICDFIEPDGSPVLLSPRYVLQQVLRRASELGYTPKIGFEIEFFLFRETMESVREKGYRNLTPLTPGQHTYSIYRSTLTEPIIGEIRRRMEEYGIRLEASNTEYGAGQWEINLHYTDALEAADQVILYKSGVKELAGLNGMIATFMAKLDHEMVGSSGHIHQSLWNEQGNAFHDPDNETQLSATTRHYAAGILDTMPEFTLFSCPTVNSYKRKIPESWASTTATWGVENRTTGLRVVPAGPKATRIENRLPGADANPYIAIAAGVAAGLYGIENKLEPPELLEGNAYALGEDQVVMLPRTLEEAVEALDKGKLARELLGEEFVEHFVATRRWESESHQAIVSDWERSRYFEMV